MVRPHPGFWRIMHGVVILYLLALVFLLFQNVDDARQLLKVWVQTNLSMCNTNSAPLADREGMSRAKDYIMTISIFQPWGGYLWCSTACTMH